VAADRNARAGRGIFSCNQTVGDRIRAGLSPFPKELAYDIILFEPAPFGNYLSRPDE
jgi:hypothetical protein